MAETFGLPLLEATMLGIPVIAGEVDFVRDVCVPQQTFDPDSPRSIARAVRRFLGNGAEAPAMYLSAEEFVERLLS
jgi:glycosyltransferase involved in cell wall biosynthesis